MHHSLIAIPSLLDLLSILQLKSAIRAISQLKTGADSFTINLMVEDSRRPGLVNKKIVIAKSSSAFIKDKKLALPAKCFQSKNACYLPVGTKKMYATLIQFLSLYAKK